MDKAKNMMDSVIDSQSKIINNLVDTTKKMQQAVVGGNVTEGGNLYNEWLQNQMSIFKNITLTNNVDATTENTTTNVEEYFKNWYNNQMSVVNQMADFNKKHFTQFNSFGTLNTEMNEQFETMNAAWANMYNNWTSTMNSAYENLSSTMKNDLNKDLFTTLYTNNNSFAKLYEVFQPMMTSFNSNGFNAEQLKNMMTAEFYKNMTEKMFTNFFPKNDFANMFESMQNNMKNYTSNSTSFTKEMYNNYTNVMNTFPTMFMTADMKKAYATSQEFFGTFTSPFANMMNFMTPGKETANFDNMIEATEKFNTFYTKQTQLQYLLYTTAQKAMETTISNNFDKLNNTTTPTTFNTFFTEWVNTNETAFNNLFTSEEFTQLKAEVTNFGLTFKKDFEKQFASNFNFTPFTFNANMEDVYKNINDLKKMVKQMQNMLEINVEEDATTAKSNTSKKK